jgi:hypothetical protein
VVYATSETPPTGDATAERAITGEIPVRFVVFLPFSVDHDTFARNYPPLPRPC